MKKIKPYLYTSLIVLGILAVVFIVKGIFPFGDNSLIWGDMHDQITAFYYHFYDSIRGNNSILVNFSTGGGINFLGILAYYILSPFNILFLIIPRDYIYLMVSVMIAFKIVACSITCLYFLRTYFKKLPCMLSVLLAIIYAFSGYGLIMYQITPWIDAMYMFPLIVMGLKKVLDLEKPTFYIITLSLSLIFSFYVTIMVIIFIFLASYIYLRVYGDKGNLKKAIINLGIATFLALLISLFIIVPAYTQISESARIGFRLSTLLNSKTGPISDKLSMLAFGGVIYAGLLHLLKRYKKHKKFLTFYGLTTAIVLIPLIIEPINKVWHFGSYVCFPYRFGFILMFLLVLGAAYAYEHFEERKPLTLEINKYASLFVTLATSTLVIRYSHRYYDRFQAVIYKLSISKDQNLIFVLLFVTLLATIGCVLVLFLNKKLSTFTITLLFAISLVHITANSFIYLGNDYNQELLTQEYRTLNKISKDYPKGEYYRVKSDVNDMIMNSGMVMKYHNLDHFTSLTGKDSLNTLKKMGYSSTWVKTYSRGGNLFLDAVLGNSYYMTNNNLSNPYYTKVNTYNDVNFYKLNKQPSFGYMISKNDTALDKNSSFEIANSLYRNIMDTEENIFEIDDKFSLDNIKKKQLDAGFIECSVIDDDYYAYFEKDVIVTGKKNLYLEVIQQLANDQNYRLNKALNLYINDNLVETDVFMEPYNGVLDLGIYENERVNIRIQLKRSIIIKDLAVGVMDIEKYENFINDKYQDNKVKYNENKISLTVNGIKEKILFLPISYNSGYHATVNNKKVDTIKLYDNFIGIPLEDGVNDINIKFIPNRFIPTLIISVISMITAVLFIKFDIFNKIYEIEVIQNIGYYVYAFIYLTLIVIYVLLTLCYLLSYLVYFNI